MSNIFDPTESDIDPEIQAAAHLVEKFAAEAGLDLEKMSEAEFSGLLQHVIGNPVAGGPSDTNQIKEASMEQQQQDQGAVITPQDVHLELVKVAQQAGVDLADVSREEYAQYFNAMLEDMQTPGYFEKAAAEAEAQADLERDLISGSNIADGILLKLAEAGIVEEEQLKTAGVRDGVKRVWEATKGKARHLEHQASGAVGRKVAPFEAHSNQSVGRKVIGTAAASGAAGMAAGAAARGGKGKKKEASDEQFQADVLKVASEYLISQGINPETGGPLDEEAAYNEAVKQAAAQLLKEQGWLP